MLEMVVENNLELLMHFLKIHLNKKFEFFDVGVGSKEIDFKGKKISGILAMSFCKRS